MNNMGVGLVPLTDPPPPGIVQGSVSIQIGLRVYLSLPNEKLLEREVVQSCVAGL